MPRIIPESHLKDVVEVIRKNGGKSPLEDILAQWGYNPPPRRSLQRWLKALVSAGRLRKSGKGPSTAYATPFEPALFEIRNVLREESPDHFPLSVASREILEYIRKPIGARQPVGYDREFLYSYQPNKTYYLSENTRKHLIRLGDTGALERPAGTYGRAIMNRLLIDLSWSSSRLEGNTYTRLDTERLIQEGQRAVGKDAQEAQMILNHKAAIEFLIDDIDNVGFNVHTFLNLHGILSENLLADAEASGRLRNRPVQIAGSAYKPLAFPPSIEEAFREILIKAGQINDPFEQSFFVLAQIPYLQPFEDVNKRVSRLAANIPLLKRNLCPLTFLGVPAPTYIDALLGLYEMSRVELLIDVFVWAYERSTREYIEIRKSLSDPDPIRLHYGREIHALVGRLVREPKADPQAEIEAEAARVIPEADRAGFTEHVLDDLKRLHEGVLARYRVRLSEFDHWKSTQKR